MNRTDHVLQNRTDYVLPTATLVFIVRGMNICHLS
jgi:hypothetical protein